MPRVAAAVAALPAAAWAQVEWPFDGHTPRQAARRPGAATALPAMDVAALRASAAAEDARVGGHKVWRFAQVNAVDVSLRDFARAPAAGGDVYTHTFSMDNALSVAVYFKDFDIPEGGALWAYGAPGRPMRGPFTHMNVHPANRGGYSIAHIDGPSVTLEYFAPDGVRLPRLGVESVATAYRTEATPPDVPPASNHSRRAGRCNIMVDCAKDSVQRCSGALWNDASSSVQCVYEDGEVPLGRWAGGGYYDEVSRAEVRLTMGGSRCSGSIINTDFGPRLLTAQHCYVIGTPSQFYIEFNFKNPSCTSYDDNAGNPNQVVTGFTGLGRGGGDIHMLELNTAIPASFNAYALGYDYSRNAPPQALGVHHPGASNMKISNSRDGARAMTSGCGGSQGGTGCWRIDQWTAATTEGGSSGSPLFNAQTQRVIGALCCGTARCPAGHGWDEYGAAFSYDNNNKMAQSIFGARETADGAEVGYYAGANVTATKARPLRDVAAGRA